MEDTHLIKVEQLRTAVKDVLEQEYLDDPKFLLRFLKARKFDVPKSEKMIKDNIQWRHNLDMDSFYKDSKLQELLGLYPIVKLGHSGENGNLIWYIPIGYIDYKGLLQCATHEEMLLHIVRLLDMVVAIMKDKFKVTDISGSFSMIIDAENLSFMQVSNWSVMNHQLCALDVLSKNYPEVLKRIIVINASRTFHFGYKMIRPFLDPVTDEKIVVYTAQEDQKTILDREIGKDLTLQHTDYMKELKSHFRTVPVNQYKSRLNK